MLALLAPLPSTSWALGWVTNRSRASGAPGPVTSRSRSPMVSLPRRRLPAAAICSRPPVSDKIRNQFVGGFLAEAQQEAAGALAILRDGFENLLFELGAHAGQLAQLLLLADPLQVVDGGDFVVLVEQRDAFGAEALDLAAARAAWAEIAASSEIALFEDPRLPISSSTAAMPLPMPGISVTLRSGFAQDIVDALRIAFDGRGGVAIAADAEAVLGGDLHQVGGFGEQARDFTIFHACCLRLYPSRCGSTWTRTSATQSSFSRMRTRTCGGDLVGFVDAHGGIDFQMQIHVPLQAGLARVTFLDAQGAGDGEADLADAFHGLRARAWCPSTAGWCREPRECRGR